MILEHAVYNWYALYAKPNSEKSILKKLVANNIECYLPLKKTLRQWTDRKKWIEEPLFRCYLFVRCSNIEYFEVLKIKGAKHFVGNGNQPQPIPEKQMENIKALIEQAEREVEVSYENIKKGTKAEVLIGPLKGIKGEIVRLKGRSRLVIRLISMGVCLHVDIAKDEIKPIVNKKSEKILNQ